MNAAQKIRNAVAEIARLREQTAANPPLQSALVRVKQFQSARFAGSYADLLASDRYGAAARFFLDELYSDKDYAERDAQFARVAAAIERLFPAAVAQTTVAMAELHVLTERLDHAMALAWLGRLEDAHDEVRRYALTWRQVGCRGERQRQLAAVIGIGREGLRLTRVPGLRMMLRMMRGPAAAAGLAALQRSLERGFDTFGAMTREPGSIEHFLAIVEERESSMMELLFDAPLVACETTLARTLGFTR